MRDSERYINKLLNEDDYRNYYTCLLSSDRILLYFRSSQESLRVQHIKDNFLKDAALETIADLAKVNITNKTTNESKTLPFKDALNIIGYPYLDSNTGTIIWTSEKNPRDPNARSKWVTMIPVQPARTEMSKAEKDEKDLRDYIRSGGTWD